jgi:2-amino-4-hydroxy-6-hydroxymethyldihydropteridine diphosphokinase
MNKLQAIEHDISPDSHRNPDGSYADRVIDIDIVAIDNMVIAEDDLKVPHPALPQRKFFLTPLAEIAPGWTHPISGKTADEMLAILEKEEK